MTARSEQIAAVLLAAGAGTRMRSGRSKVLHEICGLPLLHYPLAAAEALEPARLLVVVGRDSEEVQQRFTERADFVLQAEQRGTGHAVLQARDALRDFTGAILILYADTPVLRPDSLRRLLDTRRRTGAPLVMLTADWPLPGRVVRGADGRVARIVEVTDATPEELSIVEGNTGVYLVEAELLWKLLARLDDANQQGELYLTDVVGHAVAEGHRVEAVRLEDAEEALGVNTRQELAQAAAALRWRTAERLMAEGVTLVDPDCTYLDAGVQVGRDTVIQPGCVITGDTRIGERVLLKAYSVIESSRVEDDAVVGPMAHLRPGTHLGRGARVGNFVEVKNSRLGEGVKADHLSYIGDADVGAGASFGCGSITVNYDGVEKHRTQLGERVFVGCNANLIAPVRLEDDAFVAAGSTVTRDVPAGALAVARDRQRNVEGWRKRRDERKRRE
jgi:bifunctional UDP-N-acetylglucosamine pyrophosphorylase/glucosamine-1-phosphate N-acetyltransferase